MQLGIFAKTFVRPTLDETLDAVASHGLNCIQFNFACVGLPTLPERIAPALEKRIRRELEARKITMAAVSGTFNLIHPDMSQRRDGLSRLKVLIAAVAQASPPASSPSVSPGVGVGSETLPQPAAGTVCATPFRENYIETAPVVTLCTGTRDTDDMWRRHPDNDSPAAWRDLTASLNEVLPIAEAHDVTLAFEPEVGNVVDSARKGRRLLDELESRHLKVVMDGANLFHPGELPLTKEILTEAFDLLGKDIVIAHAKDLSRDGAAGNVAAGKGCLDYELYLSLLDGVEFSGPLILHGLDEKEVPECVAFLRGKMEITE